MPDSPLSVAQQMALAQQRMQQEMPTQLQGTSVTPMGWLDKAIAGVSGRMAGSGPVAMTTSPYTGNVQYNPDALGGQSQESINSLLAHELTHTQQVRDTPWYQRGALGALQNLFGPGYQYPVRPGELEEQPGGSLGYRQIPENYQPDPRELAAYQVQDDRNVRMGEPGVRDIQLWPDRPLAGLKKVGR